jgi:uncharacterized coiled-coil protein SlyX
LTVFLRTTSAEHYCKLNHEFHEKITNELNNILGFLSAMIDRMGRKLDRMIDRMEDWQVIQGRNLKGREANGVTIIFKVV